MQTLPEVNIMMILLNLGHKFPVGIILIAKGHGKLLIYLMFAKKKYSNAHSAGNHGSPAHAALNQFYIRKYAHERSAWLILFFRRWSCAS